MLEFHLSEKLWEYFIDRSLKDYGLFIVIISLLIYFLIDNEILVFITVNTQYVYVFFLIGLGIGIIGSIRDATTIEISNQHPRSEKRSKKHIFTGIRQITVKFPFEPITINIIIKHLFGWKQKIISYFLKRFDFTLDFSYPDTIFDFVIPPVFREITESQYPLSCQKRVIMDNTIKNDTCSVPISINQKRMEYKSTITIKMAGIAKQNTRVNSFLKILLFLLLSWKTTFVIVEND